MSRILHVPSPAPAPQRVRKVDYGGMVADALCFGVVAAGLYFLAQHSRPPAPARARQAAPPPPPPRPATVIDWGDVEAIRAEMQAAELLGVDLDATPDEIRGALRTKLAASRIHPDQGGDGQEARRLIDAKNLLMERARDAT